MMTARKTLTIAAALLTLGLGACSRSNDEARPVEENDMQAIELPEPVPSETPEPTPTPSPTPATNLADAAPPPVAPAPDEQMLDDASATGMTARVARGEASATDTAPAEQVERK
jgi:hypothetical protein